MCLASAQQHRVSTGLHNSRSCVSPGAVTCWIPWLYMWRVLSVALDAARLWSYFCFYTAFFLVGLVLIHDCCHMEAGLGTPTNHPSIYLLLGILDLYLHSNIRNRLEGDMTDCTPSTNLRTFLQLIIDNFIAYMMTYSYIKSNYNYIYIMFKEFQH